MISAPINECPWCGEDVMAEFEAVGDISYDTALEGHVTECEPWLAEQGAEYV